jgi:hypothetical protein
MKPKAIALRAPIPVRLATRARMRAGTVGELYRVLVAGGRWWLVPMMAVLGLAGLLLMVVTAIEYVAPFVYTVF